MSDKKPDQRNGHEAGSDTVVSSKTAAAGATAASSSRFLRAKDRKFDGLDDQHWKGPFFFVILADPQFGLLKKNKSWDEERSMLRIAVEHINRLKPRFVVVAGDIANAYPPPFDKDAELQKTQFDEVKEELSKIDSNIPIVCESGNHDLGEDPTQGTIDNYKQNFGDDYFSFWVDGVHFTVINSQLYKDASQAPKAKEEQDVWLREAIMEGDPKHRIMLSHIPPFILEPDEPDGYFNLDQKTRSRLLTICRNAGVKAWFCGHYHRNAGGFDGDMELVVTSAVGSYLRTDGTDPLGLSGFQGLECNESISGFRVVRVLEEGIQHDWYTLDQVPDSISLKSDGGSEREADSLQQPKKS